MMQKSLKPMNVLASTWSRESHGLYDFENKVTTKSLFSVQGPGRVVRRGEYCLFVGEDGQQLLTEDVKVLANIEVDDDQYVVTAEEEQHWIVVNQSGVYLTEGDVLKLGRIRLKVKEVSIPTQGSNLPASQSLTPHQRTMSLLSKPDLSKSSLTAQYACRICLSDTYTRLNPLMTPCKCAGTMRYIHLECLQQWLASKMTMKQSGSTMSYSWKNLECELCKEPFPLVASIDGRLVELVDMHKPGTPYLILEDDRVERGRGLHVVSLLEGGSIHLGRGHESDLRLSDISVSRLHATIQLNRNGFIASDNRAKFGTLLLARRPIHLSNTTPTLLQVNRTVLSFQHGASWSQFRGCFHSICCCFGHSSRVSSFPMESQDPLAESEVAAVIEVAEAVGPLLAETALGNRLSEGLLGETEQIDEPAEERNPFTQPDPRDELETRAQLHRQSDVD